MTKKSKKEQKKLRRKIRTRFKISGTAKKPRLCVFRSPKHISGQIIDDEKKVTIVSASDTELKKNKGGNKEKGMTKKVGIAFELGKVLAKKAKAKKINEIVFDRGSYKYHGRVKALAEGAREEGLKF